MRRIMKWVAKVDTVMIVAYSFAFVVLVYASENNSNTTNKIFYTVYVFPVMLLLLENFLIKKQDNNYNNIDIYMKEKVGRKMVWKLRSDVSKNEKVFLVIKNTGKVDIFSMHIKIVNDDGVVGWFWIPDMLNTDQECIVRAPYKKENIKEVVITCNLQTESRTKKFNGIQSGNQKKTIFSNVEVYEREKYSVFHEKGFDVFEKLERFYE